MVEDVTVGTVPVTAGAPWRCFIRPEIASAAALYVSDLRVGEAAAVRRKIGQPSGSAPQAVD